VIKRISPVFLYLVAVMFGASRASQAQVQKPLVVTWDYYAQPKTLVVHALNNSVKDITAYTITIRHKNPDGTLDEGGGTQYTSEMLSTLVTFQMAKDHIADERAWDNSNGTFRAGTRRDINMGEVKGPDVDVAVDAILYADGSFDEWNESAFKEVLAWRQGRLSVIKKAYEIMQSALDDPTDDHPAGTTLKGLAKYAVESFGRAYDDDHIDIENGVAGIDRSQEPNVKAEIWNLKYMRAQKDKTERERLTQYVAEQKKRIALMTPHCHLEIALK